MRLIRVLPLLAALALVPIAAGMAQDSTTTTRRASRTPHRTLNKEDCLSCHRSGNPERISAVPADHADYANERCMRCHRAAAAMPSRSQHPFDARHAQCATCHVAGNTVNAQPTPANHSPYTAAKCVMCHEPQTPD